MLNGRLLEYCDFQLIGPPGDFNGGVTGDYVKINECERVWYLFCCEEGTGGDDPTITIYEATSNAGADAAALAKITEYYWRVGSTNLADVTGVWNYATMTAASSLDTVSMNGSDINADTNEIIVAIPVMTTSFSEGFDYTRADIGGITGGAQYGFGLYCLENVNYAGHLRAADWLS